MCHGQSPYDYQKCIILLYHQFPTLRLHREHLRWLQVLLSLCYKCMSLIFSFIQGKKYFHFYSILSLYHKISQNISSLKEGICGKLNIYSRTIVINICLRENYIFVLFEWRTLILAVQRLSIFTRKVNWINARSQHRPFVPRYLHCFLGWILMSSSWALILLGLISNGAFCLFCILFFLACVCFQYT